MADGRSDGRCNSSGSTTGAAYVTEVQATARVATPKLVSAKASGKSKIVFKWKAVKGASGYTVFS